MNRAKNVWSSPQPLFDVEAQQATPYLDAINAHVARKPLNVMVPGHSATVGAGSDAIADFFGARAAELDIPMLLDGIDLGPNSPLEQARKLAADAWGARRTWFMTNGASQANRTAALAVSALGKRVLMQRSSHSSFTDGVLAAGLAPTFVLPSVDYANGASHGVSPEVLRQALAASPEPVAAAYIVSPSYFGATADVAGLAEVAHEFGAALIVDGAWGAHFGFHEELPESPVRLGADMVISSTHKLAGSFTQSAMLHMGYGEFVDRLETAIERAFSMTASTSQSALLMASLEVARHAMATGREAISKSLACAHELRERLRAHPNFAVLCDTFQDYPDIVATDKLRIAIDVSQLAADGHTVRGYLQEQHGIYFEMSTSTVLVAVIGAGATPDIDKLMAGLEAALAHFGLRDADHVAEQFPDLPGPGKLAMLPRDAFFAEIETVTAAEAVGRISADSLAAYPPGIPNVLPGEVITPEVVEFLSAVAESPTGYVRGAADNKVSRYRVVK